MAIQPLRAVSFVGVLLSACLLAPAQAQDPGAAVALVKRVVQMLAGADSAQRAPEALKLLEEGKGLFPPDELWVWWDLIGRTQAELGDIDACLAAFKHAAAGDTEKVFAAERSTALITLADRRMDAGDLRGAIGVLKGNESLVVDEDRFVWWGRQGYCHEALREETDALRCYDEAIKAKPDSWYRGYRARLHHLFGRWDEARVDLDADRKLVAEERQTGQRHPLRVVVDGPFRKRWPHAWRKTELRSRYGHFHVVSTVGCTESQLNDLEKELAGLDASNPADLRKIESKCKPSTELVTIATLMELMRSEYMKTINMKERDWPKGRVFKVFYFDSKGDFDSFRAMLGSPPSESMLGYYQPTWSYLALFNAAGGDQVFGLTEETMDTFFHEGWHQFFDVIADRPPIWLNEGLAELMGPTKVLNGGKKLNLAPLVKKSRDERYMSRYEVIKEATKAGTHIPFPEFFRVDRKAWNAGDTNLMYSQAWAVCYFAMRGGHKEFQKDFLRFFWGTTEGRTHAELLAKYFPDAKLEAYEKAWLAWMKKL